MFPIPAIDLKGGKVVRLLQGNFKEEKVYFDEPSKIAKTFEAEGAARLHVVDLDGALTGKPKNLKGIEKILRACLVPIEVGGGIRDLKTAALYFDLGVRWVILGTRALLDKGFLKEALDEFKEKVIVGLDARDGWVATDAWTKVTKVKASDAALEVQRLGGKTIIHTDISKDGALKGPNFEAIKNLSQNISMDVIVSGGVGSIKDLETLAALKQQNLKAVVIGKALYEKKISLKDAVKACSLKG